MRHHLVILLTAFSLAACQPKNDSSSRPAPDDNKEQPDSNPLDKDNDGMLDSWEIQYSLNTSKNDAEEDQDKDGLSNIREFTLQSNPNLSDTDSDGLGDNEEVLLGTDLLNADSDDDLLKDGEEVRFGFDPKSDLDGAIGDADDDGLLNYQEIDNGYDPHDAESNGNILEPLPGSGAAKGGNHIVYLEYSPTTLTVKNLSENTTQIANQTKDGYSSSGRIKFPIINSTGTHTAFYTVDTNLIDGESTGLVIKNLISGEISAVGNAETYPGHHRASFITSDGKYVIYDVYHAENDGIDARISVFRQNTETKSIELVSSNDLGEPSTGYSYFGSASEDGRYVVFSTRLSNLRSEDNDSPYDAFLKDMETAAIVTLNRNPQTDTMGNAKTHALDINSDGRFILFSSQSTNLIDGADSEENLYFHDTQTNTLSIVNRDSNNVIHSGEIGSGSMSDDGKLIAFTAKISGFNKANSNEFFNVYLKNLDTGQLDLISKVKTEAGNKDSNNVTLSSDGKTLFFKSSASNLDRLNPHGALFRYKLN